MVRTKKIILLSTLYFSQGIPFGFQATALPVYLRSSGVSLSGIGFISALALPWMFKALWAPLVDRYWSDRIGRRKSWLVPMQTLMVATLALSSLADPGEATMTLLALVFVMNLVAATQDIAVDGLAVDILDADELGTGNAAQVVGYKAGMLLGGGIILWLTSFLSWESLFLVMSLAAALPLALLASFKETDSDTGSVRLIDIPGILAAAGRFFASRGSWWAVSLIATYKLGEVMIDVMFKPFLVDSGFSPSQIGLWLGTWGMAASLAGSLSGGFLVKKIGVPRALGIALTLRVVPLVFEWWLTTAQPNASDVITVTMFEHFFGGALTTAMFAFMMSIVDREIGATHYTILASIEVAGKAPGGWISGIAAEASGYGAVFAAGIILSVAVFIPFAMTGKRFLAIIVKRS
ncbi:MAG TPA: MFS transporter [Spirochaetota bacterium]|nr:MFS transporter [Spirochaetota bacterium]